MVSGQNSQWPNAAYFGFYPNKLESHVPYVTGNKNTMGSSTVSHPAPLSVGILRARMLEWVCTVHPQELPSPED